MDHRDVPWLAAILTFLGALYLFVLIMAAKEGGIGAAAMVVAVPAVMYVVWRVVTVALYRGLFPDTSR